MLAVVAALLTGAWTLATTPQPALAADYAWLDNSYGVHGVGGSALELLEFDAGTVDAAGRALVATSDPDAANPGRLRRLTVDGDIDTSFAGGAISLAYRIDAVHADSSGTVTVAGSVAGSGVMTVSRFLADGSPDASFGTLGSMTVPVDRTDDPIRLVERPSGLLLLVASRVAAITPAGALDDTWGSAGLLSISGLVQDIAIDGDSVVLVHQTPGGTEVELRRYTATGAPDTTFGGDGIVDAVRTSCCRLAVHSGAYYVYGRGIASDSPLAVARYGPDGAIDPSFGINGVATGTAPTCSMTAASLSFAGGGLYLLATPVDAVSCAETTVRVERLTVDGAIDPTYATAGVQLIGEVGGRPAVTGQAIGVQPTGQVLVAVAMTAEGGVDLAGVIRLRNAPVAGAFVPLPPSRVLDTRAGTGAPAGKVPANDTLDLRIAGQGGVPANAAAVALNVTVTEPDAAGFVTVFPTGTAAPVASNLNFGPGQTIPNAVTVKLGADGRVSFRNGSGGAAHLVADIAGYYQAGVPTEAGTFAPLSPARLLDTRDGTGAPRAAVAPTGTLSLQVAGEGGVPPKGAGAVVLNVTVTEPDAAGFITVFPAGSAAPLASNLNFGPGQTIPNAVTVKLGAGGKVTFKNGSAGTVHLVADVAGYYLDGVPTQAGAFVALSPARLLDTRDGTGAPAARIAPFGTLALAVAAHGGVPAEGAAAAVLNVTVTEPGQPGFITIYPSGTAVPLASSVNFGRGQTIPNAVTVMLGDAGSVALRNGSPGASHLIADVAGYFLAW